MDVLDQKKVDRIRQVLKRRPGGITITGLASEMKVNRNILAKYLDLLVVSGQVEKQTVGTAKMYRLSHNIPVSSLPDYFSDCVVMLDRDGRIMKVNERALRFMSVPREHVTGARIGETKDPFLDSIPSDVTEGEPGNGSGPDREFSCTVRDTRHTFLLRTVPTVHEKGNRGSTLILEDLTAERKYRDLIEENESDFGFIVNDLPDLVIKFSPERKLTFANAAVCRLVRRSIEELSGRPIMPLIPDDDKPALERCLAALSRPSPAGSVALRLIDPAGSVRWFDWTVRAVFDKNGILRGYQAAGADITEKREMAEQNSRYAEAMRFLHRKAWEFGELLPDANVYDFIGRGVRELVPGAVVIINSMDRPTYSGIVECILGEEEHAVFSKHTGDNWRGKVIRPSSSLADVTLQWMAGGTLIRAPFSLYQAVCEGVPEAICRKIEDELNITEIDAIGLVDKGIPIANVVIMLRNGDTIKRPDLVELFIRMSTVALLRGKTDRNLYADSINFLRRKAMEFGELPPDGDIYEMIGKGVRELIPHAVIVVNEMYPDPHVCKLRCFVGDEDHAVFQKHCGSGWMGKEVRSGKDLVKVAIRQLAGGMLIRVPGNLHVAVSESVPKDICKKIEDELNITDIFAIGLVTGGVPVANVIIMLRNGDTIKRPELVELFIRMATIALLRRQAHQDPYADSVQFLHRKAFDFAENPDDAGIYDMIGSGVKELLPDAIVFTSSYDTPSGSWIIESCLGKKEREIFKKHRGADWVKMPIRNTMDMALQTTFSARLVKVPGDLLFATQRQVPEDICKKTENELKIGDIYCLSLISRKNILGCLTIMMKKGDTIRHTDLLEAYARLASITLLRRDAGQEPAACSAGGRDTADLPGPS